MILAEQARELPGGKIDIFGTFDRITVPILPGIVEGFTTIAMLIPENEDDLGNHQVVHRLVRPDGRPILEHAQGIGVRAAPNSFGLASVRLIFNHRGVPIREFGRHELQVLVDGQIVARHPLDVVQGDAPAR